MTQLWTFSGKIQRSVDSGYQIFHLACCRSISFLAEHISAIFFLYDGMYRSELLFEFLFLIRSSHAVLAIVSPFLPMSFEKVQSNWREQTLKPH